MTTRPFLAALFVLSGFSALIYQVAWQRVLTQEIGVDTFSIAFIVAIFLSGIGIGSYCHRFLTGLSPRQKRDLYVAIEILIGFFGILSIDLLRVVNQLDFAGSSTIAHFTINLVLLLPATIAMGLTTPLLLDIVRSSDERIGRTIGLFYGGNVLGAALGALATGLVMIEAMGLEGVCAVAATINLAIAGAFWVALKPGTATTEVAEARAAGGLGARYALGAFLFGFAALNLQMTFFRTAFNHFQIYSFIFPILLGLFLLAMSAGQYLFGWIADRSRDRPLALALGVLVYAVFLVGFFWLPIEYVQATTLAEYWRPFARFCALFLVSVMIGSGLFTMLTRFATDTGAATGARFGQMMAFASFGNFVGSLAGPLFLFTAIGTVGVAALSIAAYALGVLVLATRAHRGALALSALAIGLCAPMPYDYFSNNRMFFLPEVRANEVTEDPVGIASNYFYRGGKAWSITISRSATSTIFRDGAGAADHAMLPLEQFFRPGAGVRMLIIGMGGANYLPYLVSSDRIAEITIVELSSEVIRQVDQYGTEAIKAALASPKVTVLHDDGRRYLQRAQRAGERYDIIQNGVFQPWMSGAGNLYTVEFAMTAYRTLNENGVYLTLNLERISRAAGAVFGAAYTAPPDVYVYFHKADPVARQGLCLRHFRGDLGPLNTDDRPLVEYWMLSLFRQGVATAVSDQGEYYRQPCSTS